MITHTPAYRTAWGLNTRRWSSIVYIDQPGGLDVYEYGGSRLLGWEMLDEARNDSTALGLISANEIVIRLDNTDGAFDVMGSGNDIFRIGVRVQVYLTLDSMATPETFEIGTYYLDAWEINDSEVILTCYDRLYLLMLQRLPLVLTQFDASWNEYFALLFESLGLTIFDYSISRNLNRRQKYLWYEEGEAKKTLQLASEAARAYISVNRGSNRIVVRPRIIDGDAVLSYTGADIVTRSAPARSGQNYSRITVNAHNYVNPGPEIIFSGQQQEVKNGGLFLPGIRPPRTPFLRVTNVEISETDNVEIGTVKWGSNVIWLQILNPGPTEEIDFEVWGEAAQSVVNSVTVDDPDAETTKPLTMDNAYVQSNGDAVEMASILMRIYQPGSQLSVDYVGDPVLEVGDIINLTYRGETRKCFPYRHRLTFDGGLSGTIDAWSVRELETWIDTGIGQKSIYKVTEEAE